MYKKNSQRAKETTYEGENASSKTLPAMFVHLSKNLISELFLFLKLTQVLSDQ